MVQADPGNAAALAGAVAGQDAVIYALGFRGRGEVSFFSATTKALIAAMQASGPQRLIAITGVGAGDTKGHGGFFYDHLIYPLFTKNLYADKDRQEALIRASRLDWTILRPAPFKTRPGNEPFHILTAVAPGTRLSSVTPAEVAGLALDCAEQGLHRHQAVFFGHGVAA
jgi:putative NADH-flavin reductase